MPILGITLSCLSIIFSGIILMYSINIINSNKIAVLSKQFNESLPWYDPDADIYGEWKTNDNATLYINKDKSWKWSREDGEDNSSYDEGEIKEIYKGDSAIRESKILSKSGIIDKVNINRYSQNNDNIYYIYVELENSKYKSGNIDTNIGHIYQFMIIIDKNNNEKAQVVTLGSGEIYNVEKQKR